MSSGQFRDARLSGRRDFRGVDLSEIDASGQSLQSLDLRTDLHGSNLSGAFITDTNLCGANLHSANLEGAHLTGVTLGGATLHHASLHGAVLINVDLSGVDLSTTTLSGAQLHSAREFGTPLFDEHTVWPTDEWRMRSTMMDGVPLIEWLETLRAIGPNPTPQQLKAWAAMRDHKAEHGHHAKIGSVGQDVDAPEWLSELTETMVGSDPSPNQSSAWARMRDALSSRRSAAQMDLSAMDGAPDWMQGL